MNPIIITLAAIGTLTLLVVIIKCTIKCITIFCNLFDRVARLEKNFENKSFSDALITKELERRIFDITPKKRTRK